MYNKMAFIKSIQKLALGRSAKIGQFYDVRSDSFIHGVNAFTKPVGETAEDFTENGEVFSRLSTRRFYSREM